LCEEDERIEERDYSTLLVIIDLGFTY